MTLHRRILSLVAGLAILGLAMPSYAEFDWDAKYAGDFVTGQSNARLLALGGAGVAISDGPSAVLGNPSRIGFLAGQGVSLMHADRFESAVKVDHAAWARNNGDHAIGFGLVRQGVDDIPVTALRDRSAGINPQNRPYVANWTSASEYAFLLAYSQDRPYGTIGGAAKLLYKRLDTTDGFGLGFDLGYTKRFGGLVVGAQLRDAITTLLTWEGGRQEAIKPTLRAGAAFSLPIERFNAVATPVIEGEFRTEALGTEDAFIPHVGLEWTIRNIVSLRGGMDDDRLSYGAGLAIGPIGLDYAFVGHDDLGATHRISVGYLWGAVR